MRRIGVAAGVFALTWVLWSGHYVPLVLGLGALSCLLVTLIALRTGFFDKDVYGLHLGPRLPRYWLWLLGKIVKANLAVARLILSSRMAISPSTVFVDARSLPAVGQATLANAITLTPGTLSMDISRGIIEVHCLTAGAAEELQRGEMVRRTVRLIGE